jgi:four helix bundle protein
MPWKTFQEIEAWQVARVLNQRVWQVLQSGAFGKDFALADQINRAAGSAMDNIAEGFDGGSNAEFARFLSYSQRSCSEVRSQLVRALDRNHIDSVAFEELAALTTEIHRKSGGLIKHLRGA